jgi:hypothetical protein
MSASDEARPDSARSWDPDQALAAIKDERTIMDVDLEDAQQVAAAVQKVFKENAQVAALSIVHLALHDASPKVRLQASQYVIEVATKGAEGEADALTQLVKELYTHIEEETSTTTGEG